MAGSVPRYPLRGRFGTGAQGSLDPAERLTQDHSHNLNNKGIKKMLKSLASAVTGLKNFTIQLDVLGNNLANVRTIGFKGSRVTFADTRSQSLTGISRGFDGGFGNQKQIGLGMTISSTELDFTQGSLEFTGTATDLAIEGNSFFVLSDGERNRFTRAGNFFFNGQGILVNPDGLAVQGWQADDNGVINVFSPLSELFLDSNLSSPAAKTGQISLSGNLDATLTPRANVLTAGIALTLSADGSLATGTADLNDLTQTTTPLVSGDTIDIAGTLPDGTAVSATFTYSTDGTTIDDLITVINAAYGGTAVASIVDGKLTLTDVVGGDSSTTLALSSAADIALSAIDTTVTGFTGTVSTSVAIFDSLGDAHNLVITFTNTEVENQWTWAASFVGGKETIVDGGSGTIQFDNNGVVIAFDVDGAATGIVIEPGSGGSQFTVQLDVQGGVGFSGMTQFASDPTLIVRDQDGRPTGSLLRFAIDTTGVLTGIFSNEKNITLAQIALAEFPNPVGLFRSGGGIFDVTSSAGRPIIGIAGDQFSSSILSGSLETSNVDLVKQFTDMIVTQRAFQANARVVTTADQILEETLRLKR